MVELWAIFHGLEVAWSRS